MSAEVYVRTVAITPHDTNELVDSLSGVYVGVAGDIVLQLQRDSADVTLKNVPAGTTLRIRPKLIKASGTTASQLVGLI